MSNKGIEAVLSRAMSDNAFSALLFSNLDQALAGFELTEEEHAKLKGLSKAEFDTLTSAPEARKSFGIIVDQRGGWDGNHNQTVLHIRK